MKKLTTSFLLTFVLISSICAGESSTFSPDSEIGKWRSFVGVEGGVGYLHLSLHSWLHLTPFSQQHKDLVFCGDSRWMAEI